MKHVIGARPRKKNRCVAIGSRAALMGSDKTEKQVKKVWIRLDILQDDQVLIKTKLD
jgi:hypothetical protein